MSLRRRTQAQSRGEKTPDTVSSREGSAEDKDLDVNPVKEPETGILGTEGGDDTPVSENDAVVIEETDDTSAPEEEVVTEEYTTADSEADGTTETEDETEEDSDDTPAGPDEEENSEDKPVEGIAAEKVDGGRATAAGYGNIDGPANQSKSKKKSKKKT